MRKDTSNQFLKSFKSYLFSSKLIKLNQSIFYFNLLLFFLSINSFSQNAVRPNQNSEKKSVSVIKLDDYLQSLVTSSDKSTGNKDYTNLLSLIKDIKSTVYLKNGLVKTYGETPTCLRSDVSSIKLASDSKTSMNDVEIVIINVDNPKDLETSIDLSFVTNLKKVRYVYLLLDFEVSPTALSSWIKNTNTNCVVLYKIDNRS